MEYGNTFHNFCATAVKEQSPKVANYWSPQMCTSLCDIYLKDNEYFTLPNIYFYFEYNMLICVLMANDFVI